MFEHYNIRVRGLGHAIWLWIPCPKRGMKNISWKECLNCSDMEKHPDCPLLAIRSDFTPRGYKKGIYHCTETYNPRRAYFNRITDYAQGWIKNFSAIDFFIGKAIHDRIQRKYPREACEVRVWKWYNDSEYGDFRGTGSVDVVDSISALLLELKSCMSLKYYLMRGKPSDDHVWQSRVYYEWGVDCKPKIFNPLREARIVYVAKTKYSPKRYKEFIVPLEFNKGLEENIRLLHIGVMTDTPPPKLCHGVTKPTASRFPCSWCSNFDGCLKDWKSRGH